MGSAHFRETVSTVPGLFAVVLTVGAVGVAAVTRSVALVAGAGILLVGLWIVYLLYRLVVAVETLAERDSI